jgi:hypothetical protein
VKTVRGLNLRLAPQASQARDPTHRAASAAHHRRREPGKIALATSTLERLFEFWRPLGPLSLRAEADPSVHRTAEDPQSAQHREPTRVTPREFPAQYRQALGFP